MEAPTMGSADDSLGVEPAVDVPCRRELLSDPGDPRGPIGVVRVASAQRAWPVTRRERDRLVVEVEPGEVARPPLLVPPASELERARDPEVARVEADDLAARMQDPAVAGPRAA